MLRWAIIFFLVAILAGLLRFGGIAGAAADIARILFFIFIVMFIVSLVTTSPRCARGPREARAPST